MRLSIAIDCKQKKSKQAWLRLFARPTELFSGAVTKLRLCVRLLLLFSLLPYTSLHAENLLMLAQDFPPYTYQEDGKQVGINTEIITRVLEAENIPYNLEIINWARAQKIVQSTPNTGLLSAGRSEVRENIYGWIGPLVSSRSYLFNLTSRDDINVKTAADLKQYRVASTRHSVYVGVLRDLGLSEEENIMMVSSTEDTYKALFQNRADFIVGSDMTTPYNLRRLGYDLTSIKIAKELKITKMNNYLAVNKSFSAELIERCNARIAQMWESGEVDKIIDKYRLFPGPAHIFRPGDQ